jgi:Ca2+-transporting ATPase
MANSEMAPTRIFHRGLSDAEVIASRERHGRNVLTPPEREPWWRQFLSKFDDPVIRILMIAASIAIVVGLFEGKYAEGVGIVTAILLATTLAFVNEFRANREFEVLNQVNDHVEVKVFRNGKCTTIPKCDLVVGDTVLIEVGEELPTDGKVLEAVSLLVGQAKLTGESEPVRKVPEGVPVPGEAQGAYPPHVLLRSTTVADGHGIYEVTAVGDATEIGQAARAAAEVAAGEPTPLNRQLERLSKVIGVVGFGVAGLTFAALLIHGVISEAVVLSPQQWSFTGLLFVSTLLALARVWLPIVFDARELLGLGGEPPEWLDDDSLAGWAKAVAAGAVVFAVGLGGGYSMGLIPETPATWLPMQAGSEFLKYFMIAVTLIVVAVPEGLAMSVTLSLAYSMRKMTATNNLVRRMHACETIGAATVICSDKTGTLTLNEMRVFEAHFPCMDGGTLRDASAGRDLVVEAICANSTAHLDRTQEETVFPIGNPTEGALLLWLDKYGIDYAVHRDAFPRQYQLTFSTERKWMGTLGRSTVNGAYVLHAKGAPEILLERCTHLRTAEGERPIGEDAEKIRAALKGFQGRAMRTLGFAQRTLVDHGEHENLEHLAEELTWLGFAAIADPVRPEVPPALAACREAGIEVKMVTGDNPETAREIGAQIGLVTAGAPASAYVNAREFDGMDEHRTRSAAKDLRILARARPLDKLNLVRALQRENHVVAVTGDGANDAAALNQADVGLAMGKVGTAVAKEASDIILLDDSFSSIVNAVMWGRSLYENIQRFVLFQLTINVAALTIAMIGPIIGVELPFTVVQMLWINLIMDSFAALALATEPPHWSVMKRPPRDPRAFIVTPAMARGIFGTGLFFVFVLVGVLLYMQRDGETSAYELSQFFTLFVLLQFWNLFNARCLGRSQSALSGLGQNKMFLIIAVAILLGQVALVQFGGSVFRAVPLSLVDWGVLLGVSSLVLWAGELHRFVQRARAPRAA